MPTLERPIHPALTGLLERIERKLDQHGLSPRDASLQATGKPDLIRDLKRSKGMPGAERLDRLAQVLGTTSEWLLRGGNEGEAEARAATARASVKTEVAASDVGDPRLAFHGQQPLKALPLLGTALGGSLDDLDENVDLVELHLGEVLEYLRRPASMANDPDAYALTVLNDSMAPKFEAGDAVAISPRTPVSIGDYVIVQLRCPQLEDERITMVLIKRLVRRTAAHVELEQFNPPINFKVDIKRVACMHHVKGALF